VNSHEIKLIIHDQLILINCGVLSHVEGSSGIVHSKICSHR
jgi:hypothetical protein